MSYGFMKSVYIEVYSPATKTRGAELDEVIRKAEQTEIEYRKAQVIHGGKWQYWFIFFNINTIDIVMIIRLSYSEAPPERYFWVGGQSIFYFLYIST